MSAECGLGKIDWNMTVQIVFPALEKFVFLDVQYDVEIARRTTFSTGITLAGNTEF